MKFFKTIGKGAGALVQLATPVVLSAMNPESLINVGAGAVLKHGVKPFDNQKIPMASVAATVLVRYLHGAVTTGDWVGGIVGAVQGGVQQAGIGWAIHQSVKVPAAELIKDPVLAERVGPGGKFSL